ncbi:MAG: helix-turn-helix domain-containing protein, partial [Synechococcaceae cyanobacterium SM2_3_2]|nr:helix-turn-helix domain-containing protein [Synechococcaceae cyanobacterium SM2_3_2]NJM00593.1 helix-turn-helix domain-containing protein [Synechococcaceae cyanobacterium SM2_3_2]
MPYSVDLKIRVLQFVEQGGGISNAAKLYQVGRATIYRWLGQT